MVSRDESSSCSVTRERSFSTRLVVKLAASLLVVMADIFRVSPTDAMDKCSRACLVLPTHTGSMRSRTIRRPKGGEEGHATRSENDLHRSARNWLLHDHRDNR